MNWDAIGALSEVIGAMAVVVTLLYLAIQLKQNRRDVQSNNFHQISISFNDLNRQIAGDPELSRIYSIGFTDYESLSSLEKTQFELIFFTALRVYDSLYYQVKRGTGDLDLWEAELETLRWFCSTPGGRKCWEQLTLRVSKSFTHLINDLMAESVA
jgi:hypothetical protein